MAHIILLPVEAVETVENEETQIPIHIARKFATLDLISKGRAGWNMVTSWSDAEARNFGREAHVDYDTRYERALEFVESGVIHSRDFVSGEHALSELPELFKQMTTGNHAVKTLIRVRE